MRKVADARARRQLYKLFDDYNDRKRHENQRTKAYHQERHLNIRKM